MDLRYYLFTHVHFDIAYNDDRIIEINVSTDPTQTVDITEDEPVKVEFSYSVKWKETTIPFERRMEKYSRYSFLPQHLEVRGTPWVAGACPPRPPLPQPPAPAMHSSRASRGARRAWGQPTPHLPACLHSPRPCARPGGKQRGADPRGAPCRSTGSPSSTRA